MESNIKIKDTPKLKISSAVFGDKDIAGDSTGSIKNIHKTISKLAGHVRKSLIRIKGLEEKFSKVESKTEVDNVGKKLPGGSNVNQSLVETNKILVEIQKQLALDFAIASALAGVPSLLKNLPPIYNNPPPTVNGDLAKYLPPSNNFLPALPA